MSENNAILSKTSEMKIGKVTYIVTEHYRENGRTAEDIFSKLVLNRISEELKTPKFGIE